MHNCSHWEDAGVQCSNTSPAQAAFTAEFRDVPESHGGENTFTIEIVFSETPHGTGGELPGMKNVTLKNILEVTNGAVQSVYRVNSDGAHRIATIEPDGRDDVTIALSPSPDCDEPRSICTETGERLSTPIIAHIPGPGNETPLTAHFEDVPAGHDGAAVFELTLAFSEAVFDGTEGFNKNQAVRDALAVSGGTVTNARRVDPGAFDAWQVRVRPSGDGAVSLSLVPAPDCAAAGALCTPDGRALSNAVAARVAGPADGDTSPEPVAPPLTARFENVPAEHDGTSPFTIEIRFSEMPHGTGGQLPGMPNGVMRRAMAVDGGRAATVRRVDGSHVHRIITIEPDGMSAVEVKLEPQASCSATGAVCTEDGRALSNTVAARVQGPAGLAVADARVEEAPGAVLAFEVTLDRARQQQTTVDYATGDGSAEAGSDYEAVQGTLRFAPGETSKTVDVTVLDDAHDEGEETMTLTLSNPSGAYLADAEATGTIENTDHMPQAWLARFGRTVAEQVLDAVDERMRAGPQTGTQVTLAGQRLGGGTPDADETLAEAEDQGAAPGPLELAARGSGRDTRGIARGDAARAADGLLLCADDRRERRRRATQACGAGARTRASTGEEGDLTLEGNVTSLLLGADWTRERFTAGLMLSHADGDGTYPGGRQRRGDLDADRALPLGAVCHERPRSGMGRSRLRRGRADAEAGERRVVRDGHGPRNGGGGTSRGSGRGAPGGRPGTRGQDRRDGRSHVVGRHARRRRQPRGRNRGRDAAPARARGHVARPRARHGHARAPARDGRAP